MGRAIVRQPQVFCMDEPLSNLDAKLRVSTRTQIAALQQRLGITTVYVTHDQVEAMTMGDRVAVMKDGILQQVDTPLALYDHPDNLFVAGFIGAEEGGLPVQITVIEELGADGFLHGTSDVEGTPENVIVRIEARQKLQKGETVHVTTDPDRVHVFDTETGKRLND